MGFEYNENLNNGPLNIGTIGITEVSYLSVWIDSKPIVWEFCCKCLSYQLSLPVNQSLERRTLNFVVDSDFKYLNI